MAIPKKKIDMSLSPLEASPRVVPAAWLDVNDHMNVAYYVMAFDEALDSIWYGLGIGDDYVAETNCGGFALEAHICYLKELRRGDKIKMTYQLLAVDEKRHHYFMSMFNVSENYLAATSEQVSIHVDLAARRACPYPKSIYNNLQKVLENHRHLPRPPQVGASISLKRKK